MRITSVTVAVPPMTRKNSIQTQPSSSIVYYSQTRTTEYRKMPNMMAALLNIGGALC